MMIVRFLALLVILFPLSVSAQEMISTPAKQAIVVDFETGVVLFEKNADDRMPTSSMSKTLTMYEVFARLKSGHLSLNDTFPVSQKAWKKGGSKMFVEQGRKVKLEDLIRGVIVQSGNDATIVIAEGLEGTEDNFAEALNTRAAEIGMTDSNFMNASGWPDSNHYSTARDLSKLAYAMIKNFPQYYPYHAETEFTYNNITQPNRNPLLYKNIGADGIKTGHTDDGGYGLMGSGVHDNRRVIIIINGLVSQKARADESEKLLKWGLRQFENKVVATAMETVGEAPIIMGKSKTVPVTIAEDITATIPRGSLEKVALSFVPNDNIIAPVSAGDKVGLLNIKTSDDRTITVTAIASQDVEQLNLIMRSFVKAKTFITDLIQGLIG